MRKLFLILCLLTLSSLARADENYPHIWRSSVTSSADFNSFIASGPVILHRIMVNTAATGYVQFFNGQVSTAALTAYENVDTSQTGPFYTEYDVVFSSGLLYGKSGTANVTILWDWQASIPKGKEGTGHR